MKTILATLLASTALVQATTITINQDNQSVLDFSIDWGSPIAEWGTSSTGTGGSKVQWLTQISRNRNYYWVEIDTLLDPTLQGFGVRFWDNPEYFGPVTTSFGSPNISFVGTLLPQVLPLDWTQYGARFVYGTSPVPEQGGTGWLMLLGLAGLIVWRRYD